jgi:beta-glucanase (GH16 family)
MLTVFLQYFNNSQEIDMEFLSGQFNATSHPVNLVLQSVQSAEQGFSAQGTPTFQLHQLPFYPDENFHEYRFDWTPDAVYFYADGALLDVMNMSVPSHAGHLTLSHWSNGDPGWSMGPPATDAILTVSYAKAYFNSSDPSRWADYASRCTDPSAPDAVCPIPNQTTAPDNNSTAHTFFFSYGTNATANQTVFNPTATPTATPTPNGAAAMAGCGGMLAMLGTSLALALAWALI